MTPLDEQRMLLSDGTVIARAYTYDGYRGFEAMRKWCKAKGYDMQKVQAAFAATDGDYAYEPRHRNAEKAPIVIDERT